MRVFRRLMRTVLPGHRWSITIAILCALGISATPYAFSFLGKWLVDDVLAVGGGLARITDEGEMISLLFRFFLISIGFHVVGTLLAVLSEYLNSRAVHRAIYRLRSSVFEKVELVDHASYSKESPGQLMTRIMDDTGAVPGNVTHIVINFVTQLAMLALGIVLLIRLDPTLTVYAAISLPFYAVVCAVFLPRIKRNTEDVRVRWAQLIAYAVERLVHIITVKNYARETAEVEEFGSRVDTSLGLNRRQHKLNLFFGSLSAIITAAATLAVLTVGFMRLRNGSMLLGEVLAFYQVTAQLFVPISALVGLTVVSQTVRVYGERVFQILDAESSLPSEGRKLPTGGDIEFNGVSLAYSEGGPFAVHDLSIGIPGGAEVALVGPTGCGKSTMLLLLTRLIDPSEGSISIGGIDIREIDLNEHRKSIGNVLFDSRLFSGSIAENVSFDSASVTRDEIIQACRTVGLDERIRGIPGGYDARVGTGGVQLSDEEILKINLARAIITRPRIITVDDTYASVPEETERTLRIALRKALPDATILIATSRLSIARECGLICVMQKGRIIESGSHDLLMESYGLYRRMYARQMGLPS